MRLAGIAVSLPFYIGAPAAVSVARGDVGISDPQQLGGLVQFFESENLNHVMLINV
eukprot:SAG31_NODE_2434_length_5705_cov_6.754014_8_plen_56_part_00